MAVVTGLVSGNGYIDDYYVVYEAMLLLCVAACRRLGDVVFRGATRRSVTSRDVSRSIGVICSS